MTTIHELQDYQKDRPWERETIGELIRQVMQSRNLGDFYNGMQAWDSGQQCQETARDYQRAVSRRMVAMELWYTEEPQHQFYAELVWLPEARCFYSHVDAVEKKREVA